MCTLFSRSSLVVFEAEGHIAHLRRYRTRGDFHANVYFTT